MDTATSEQVGGHPPRRQKHGGAMQTLLTSGDNPRIIKQIVKFNAGGVVPPRPASTPGVRRGSWAMVTMGAVDSRRSTTPPALNFANYPTIRALTYAVYIVYRPPACLLAPLQLWPPACFWRRGVHGAVIHLETSQFRTSGGFGWSFVLHRLINLET